jgi:hypothetical protein
MEQPLIKTVIQSLANVVLLVKREEIRLDSGKSEKHFRATTPFYRVLERVYIECFVCSIYTYLPEFDKNSSGRVFYDSRIMMQIIDTIYLNTLEDSDFKVNTFHVSRKLVEFFLETHFHAVLKNNLVHEEVLTANKETLSNEVFNTKTFIKKSFTALLYSKPLCNNPRIVPFKIPANTITIKKRVAATISGSEIREIPFAIYGPKTLADYSTSIAGTTPLRAEWRVAYDEHGSSYSVCYRSFVVAPSDITISVDQEINLTTPP